MRRILQRGAALLLLGMRKYNSMQVPGPRTRLLIWSLCSILALYAIFAYWQAQGRRNYYPDEATYTYVGWSWGQGFWPYRDSWDHKGPMVYATTMVRTALAGTEPEMLGGQEIAFGIANALVLAGIAYCLWGGASPALAFVLYILLWTLRAPESGLQVSTPSSLIALFTTASILAAFAITRSTRFGISALLAVLIGLFGGLALSTKPTAAAGIIVGLGLVWSSQSWQRMRDRVVLTGGVALGVGIPIVLFGLAFYYAHALDALVDCYILFNPLRARLELQDIGILNLIHRERETLVTAGVIRLTIAELAVAALAPIRQRLPLARGSLIAHRYELVVPAWLILELLLHLSNGAFIYQVQTVLPALALGATWLLVAASRQAFLPGRGWSILVGLAIFFPLVHAVSSIHPSTNALFRRDPAWNRMVQDVIATTDPGDTILTIGWESSRVLDEVQRRNASRYFYPVPLYQRDYASDQRWDEVLGEISSKTAPKIILLDVTDLPQPASGGRTVEWALSRFDRADLQVWPAIEDDTRYAERERFKEFIASHYHLDYCIPKDCLLRRSP